MSGEHTHKSVNTVTQINLNINAPCIKSVGRADYPNQMNNSIRDDHDLSSSHRLPGEII